MTGKADFTEQEWELVREGPTAAGMYALMASTGGSFRETWALAKTYAEARQERGENELLDALVAEKPPVKRYEWQNSWSTRARRKLSRGRRATGTEELSGRGRALPHFVLEVAGNCQGAQGEGEASAETSVRR